MSDKNLYAVRVERDAFATMYVEAEGENEAADLAASEFREEDYFEGWLELGFGPARPVDSPESVASRELDMLIHHERPARTDINGRSYPPDISVADWFKERERMLREREKTPGTKEYYEALEREGQLAIGA